MKNLIIFATLLIFILNISDNVIKAEAQDNDPVLDVDGNELKTGTSYYLSPIIWPGGGLTIYPMANETCNYGVTQLSLFADGLPVTFAYGGTDLGEVVRESTNFTVAFSPGILFCQAVWKVDEYDETAKPYFVTAGDIDVTQAIANWWFQLRKGSSPLGGYRFVFCRKDCEFCDQICTNVGIVVYEGVFRLVLDGNDSPFSTFLFRKFGPCTTKNSKALVA